MPKIDWNTAGRWLSPENLLAVAKRERRERIKGPSPWKLWLTAVLVFFFLSYPAVRLPLLSPQPSVAHLSSPAPQRSITPLPLFSPQQGIAFRGAGSPAPPAGITATNTGDALCVGGPTGGVINLGTTAATGNFIVVAVSQQGSPTATDNKGNTYTALTATGGVTPPAGRTFYVANAAGGSSHTLTIGGTFAGGCAAVFSGLTSSPFDKESHIADHTGTTVQPGSVAPAGTPSLVISEVNGGVPTGIDSSFIQSGILPLSGGNNYAVVLYYKITSSTENPTITFSTTATAAGQNAVFK